MIKALINLYHWFEKHLAVYYAVLAVVLAVSVAGACQISLEENITDFFNTSEAGQQSVFDNIKAKDKIIVMVSGTDPDAMVEAADVFADELQPLCENGLINSVTTGVDADAIDACTSFIYDYLPIFLDDKAWEGIEAGMTDEAIGKRVEDIHSLLTSPSGMVVGDILMKDPLSIGVPVLQSFEKLNPSLEYEIYSDRLFTPDMSTMLMFIEPSRGMGDTGANGEMVSMLEKAEIAAEREGVSIVCTGAPVIAVHNARQIKKDTALTLSIALIFILAVIFLSFRNRRSVPLIILPPLFGAVFSLAILWLIKGSVSAIALGAGTVVLGIALSYSIHVIAHINHASSPEEVISDLAMPLSIGSLTTIGAFGALVFTSSPLLRDMGFFAVFALVGTTVFCLVFLPHFIRNFKKSEPGKLLNLIEKWNGYSYDSNKYVLIGIALLFIVTLFFYRDVEFNEDMTAINYMPERIAAAEKRSQELFEGDSSSVFIVSAAANLEELSARYSKLEDTMAVFKADNKISDYTSISSLVVSPEVQASRIDRWNSYWKEHGETALKTINDKAVRSGFRDGAFKGFARMLEREYVPCGYTAGEVGNLPGVSEWLNVEGGMMTLLMSVNVAEESKAAVYSQLAAMDGTAVVDRSWFSSKMVEDTGDDFNFILLISSVLVFIALMISYGRFDLAMLAFLPMCISWVIILGLMALLDIKFNIVNIILATFIFGIGDDFSIFIMDGLIREYRTGRKILSAHKSSIFFSAFTVLVGMGVLIFSQHPAMKSIAVISVIGIAIVVLVSYTVQPFLFRFFVTSRTAKGGAPYTLGSILFTMYCYLYFFLGCILAQLWMLVLMALPIKKRTKKSLFHYLIYYICHFFLRTIPKVKIRFNNPTGENYDEPSVVIANHQSFVDILVMLASHPKMLIVTKNYVWHSPFFGWIVRYADFYNASDGYEGLVRNMKDRMSEGYSIAVFPEGTRSPDSSIMRFHKGAFFLANELKADILPVLIYGTGQVASKEQSFNLKDGWMIATTLPRVRYGDGRFGTTYQEQAKNYRRYFEAELEKAHDIYGRAENPYFNYALMMNYIYKGPVLEWYMRFKVKSDGKYDFWDRIVPREATITDVGCGYGQMDFMLGLLSPKRRIHAIDYDRDKIEVAQHCFSCKDNVKFEYGDMRTVEFGRSDIFLFSDSLHYISWEDQKKVLLRAAENLNEGGVIIIRDGDASDQQKHRIITKIEFLSTKITKFNKTSQQLCFATVDGMAEFARENNLKFTLERYESKSSETLYYFSRS